MNKATEITPPRNTALLCESEDGAEFIGKRDSLFAVLGLYSKHDRETDIFAVRWFSLEGDKWLPCAAPASWRRLADTDPEWVVDEIGKVDKL